MIFSMSSMRNRILVLLLFCTSLVMFGSGVFYIYYARNSLLREFDAELLYRAKTLAALVEYEVDEEDPNVLVLEFEHSDLPFFLVGMSDTYFEYRSHEGAVLNSSPTLEDGNLSHSEVNNSNPLIEAVILPNGESARQVTYRFTPYVEIDTEGGESIVYTEFDTLPYEVNPISISLARPTARVNHILSQLVITISGTWVVTSIFLGFSMYWLVGRGLRPAVDLSLQLKRIEGDVRNRRIDLPKMPLELVPVVASTNAMLDRVERYIITEQELLHNLAHELRTPLSGLRTLLEVTGRKPRTIGYYQDVCLQALHMVIGMQAITYTLIEMAKLESGQMPTTKEPVYLELIVEECLGNLAVLVQKRGIQISRVYSNPSSVITDHNLLQSILRNLINNALTYADEGTEVEIQINGNQSIEISNLCTSFDPKNHDRIWERFWRQDGVRTVGSGHCGLGLPICRQLADVLGLKIDLSVKKSGQFTARLDFQIG